MNIVYLYSLASVGVVSLVAFVGVLTISINQKRLQRFIFLFVALAVGALLGDSFIHLIPESFANTDNPLQVSLLIISGILAFFVLEHALRWHHSHGHVHGGGDDLQRTDNGKCDSGTLGQMVIVSDGLHNFIDGIIIGASYLVSIPLGIATTIAIILHEIPQEIGDFGLLLHAGCSKARALLINFFSALTSFLGLIVVFLFSAKIDSFLPIAIPFAAGVFIYLATADLIPELQQKHGFWKIFFELLLVGVGIFAMYLLLFLEY